MLFNDRNKQQSVHILKLIIFIQNVFTNLFIDFSSDRHELHMYSYYWLIIHMGCKIKHCIQSRFVGSYYTELFLYSELILFLTLNVAHFFHNSQVMNTFAYSISINFVSFKFFQLDTSLLYTYLVLHPPVYWILANFLYLLSYFWI